MASFAAKDGKENRPSYDLPAYTVEGISKLPDPIKQPIPAIRRGMTETSLWFEFTVSKSGRTSKIRSERPLFSLGHVDDKERDFATQMISKLASWKFSPATDINGDPVAVKMRVKVHVVKHARDTKVLTTLIPENGVLRTSTLAHAR